MDGLKGKTVILVTHQVDFLPAFDFVLVISFMCLSSCCDSSTEVTNNYQFVTNFELLISFIYPFCFRNYEYES